jgi:hypothetical protein
MTKDNVEPVAKDNSNYRLDPPEAEPTQRQWAGLTDEDVTWLCNTAKSHEQTWGMFVRAIEAKLREKNAASSPAIPDALTRADGEGPEYTSGWNDCRAEILKGMK